MKTWLLALALSLPATAAQPTSLRLVEDPAPGDFSAAVVDVPAPAPMARLAADTPVATPAPAASLAATTRAAGGGKVPWWVALITGLGGFVIGFFSCYLCALLVATSYFY